MKIAEGIYAYIWKGVFENNCNMYYFGEPLNILFDPGLARHLDLRFEAMRQDGISPDDVRTVVSTHSHPDHFEGCEYFMKKGLPVGMLVEEIDFLNEVGPEFFAMFGMKFPSFSFDVRMEEGVWNVNGVNLEVFQTPGHSPGSACIYWKEKKALVCGDLIFKESVGRVDFPGGDPAKLKESIGRMAGLDIEYLLPGHMDMVTGAKSVVRNFELIKQYIFPQI
ncbi:MAG: MBL fold metallo-hydrolase [Spirochaetes bacterium]|nr:MAG: MBL fold metallo-hydrolase [Spirochaetota bacterium]